MTRESVSKEKLFGSLDFQSLRSDPDFKEDSVREMIILPILRELGYQQDDIVRSKTLSHPFLKIGSKKRAINLIPDYCLKVENTFAWVLDAKAPDQSVLDGEHVEQVYSYATHPEIRSTYFAICNGIEFVVFRRESTNEPVLQFSVDEIEHSWGRLSMLLSPGSFQVGKAIDRKSTRLYS